MSVMVRFSVILPVCHGGVFLKDALRSIGQMEYAKHLFEVIIAVPADDRASLEIINSEAAGINITVRHVTTACRNRSAMLNAAIAEAKGLILVFADDDCIFLPDWLIKIDGALERSPDAGVIGGQDMHVETASSFNIALDYVFNSFIGTGGLRGTTEKSVGKYYPKLWNMAVPRDAADQVAGNSYSGPHGIFDEGLEVHEDVELAERIERSGRPIVYAPEVRVLHSRDTTLKSFTVRSFNMARTSRSFGIHRLPHALLTAFALGMITLGITSITSGQARVYFISLGAVYAAVLLISAFGGFRRSGQCAVGMYVPLLLIALHLSRGLGYLFPLRGLK